MVSSGVVAPITHPEDVRRHLITSSRQQHASFHDGTYKCTSLRPDPACTSMHAAASLNVPVPFLLQSHLIPIALVPHETDREVVKLSLSLQPIHVARRYPTSMQASASLNVPFPTLLQSHLIPVARVPHRTVREVVKLCLRLQPIHIARRYPNKCSREAPMRLVPPALIAQNTCIQHWPNRLQLCLALDRIRKL